jgi:hypothetical protein
MKTMKNIKNFNEFTNEGLRDWWSRPRNQGMSDNGSPKDFYNLFGRVLLAIPTLGTNILLEYGIDYVQNMIAKNKHLNNIINKLSNDELISDYVKNKNLDFSEHEGPGIESENIINQKIRDILTEEEFLYLVNHLRSIVDKLRDNSKTVSAKDFQEH